MKFENVMQDVKFHLFIIIIIILMRISLGLTFEKPIVEIHC